MTADTIDTYSYYKKLVNAGMTEEQAETQIEVMMDLFTKTNLNKPIELQPDEPLVKQPNKPFWKEAAKTFFWTYLIGMAVTIVIVLEIVGLKHISFT